MPPWWAKASPVIGVVLTLLLVAVLVVRVTRDSGSIDASADGDPTAAVAGEEPGPSPGSASGDQQPGSSDDQQPGSSEEPEPEPNTQPNTENDEGREPKKDGNQRPTIDPDLVDEVEELLDTDERPDPERPEPQPAVFRVSSFNVLGHSHTTARGNKPQYAEGPTRMRWSVQLLRTYDIDVVGFQEFELPQFNAFRQLTGGGFGVFPGASLGRNPVRNSIAWRLDTWKMVQAETIPIPYFRGKRVPMPYVLLEHVGTGQRVFFINVHNPASVKGRGNNEPWRDLGTRLEIDLVERLRAQTGLPVVLMGDFNERDEAFCKVTGPGGMVAANGGSASPCRPPANQGIDWIFGTKDIAFSDYVRSRSGLVARTTDHPIIVSTAQVG